MMIIPPLFRLSVFFLILSFIGSIVVGFTVLRQALTSLAGAGWADYLGVSPDRAFNYLLACMNDSQCFGTFVSLGWDLYPTWIAVTVAGLMVSTIVLAVLLRSVKHRRYDPATGRWSTKADLKRKGYLQDPKRKDQRGYVGMHPSGKMIRVPQNIRFSHGLVLGGPGARKSTGYHWQNILMDAQDGWSVIIFDLKYPDPTGGFVSSLPHFEKHGYDVYAFTPYDKHTHHLPLIAEAVDEMVARDLAEMLIPPSEDGGAGFYRNTERSILAGLLMHAAYCNISLTELHAIVLGGPSAIRTFINGEKNNPKRKPAVPTALDMVGGLLKAETKDQQGLAQGIEGKLQFFANENLGRATQPSEFPWLNIPLDQIGKKKSLLYVGLPQKNVDGGSGKLLLQLIKRMIDSALSQTAYENHGKVPNPVSFYLDEFPSLGKLPNVESNFATMRSRQVAYHLTIQNISQGKAIYTDAGFKSFFTSNFQTIMLFPSFIKFEDAEYISKILGSTMTTMYGEGQSKGGLHNTTSLNERESTRPLVTIDEMQTWPDNQAIVILNGVPHTRVIVPGIWEKRSGGVNNPFKKVFDSLDQTMDVGAYVQRLLARSKVAYERSILEKHHAIVSTKQLGTINAEKRKAPPSVSFRAKSFLERARYLINPKAVPADLQEHVGSAHPTNVAPATRKVPTPTRKSRAVLTPPDPLQATPDPATLEPVTTEAGKTFVPREAINKLVSHIATVRASVKVNGDRSSRRIEQLTVPTEVINNIFKPDQVATLVEHGYFTRQDHFMQVQLDKDGLLEPSRAKFLLKQLPDTAPGKEVDYNRARNAFHKGLLSILDNDLDINVEANGKTRELQRVKFNPFAMPEDLQAEFQQAWMAHQILQLRDGMAFGTRKALRGASPALKERLLQLYDTKRGVQPTPAPAAPQSAATNQPQSQPPPAEAPAAPKPQKPQKDPSPTQPQATGTAAPPHAPKPYVPVAPQPPQPAPAAAQETVAHAAQQKAPTSPGQKAAPQPVAAAPRTPAVAQRTSVNATAVAERPPAQSPQPAREAEKPAAATQQPGSQQAPAQPATQATAQPQVQDAGRTEQQKPEQPRKPSPKSQRRAPAKPATRAGRAPAATPTAAPPQQAEQEQYRWITRPNPTNPNAKPDYVMVPTTPTLVRRFKNYITRRTVNLRRPGVAVTLVKDCVGSITHSEYTLFTDAYAQHSDQPPLPPIPAAAVTKPVGAGMSGRKIILSPSELKAKEDGRAFLAWLHEHAAQIDGHPERDVDRPALQGLTYEPSILTLGERHMHAELMVTSPEYAGLDKTLPVSPVVRVYIPDS